MFFFGLVGGLTHFIVLYIIKKLSKYSNRKTNRVGAKEVRIRDEKT